MSGKVRITDPKSGIQATVVDGIEEHALVVATRELKTYYNTNVQFTNPVYGSAMNQDAGFTGTPILIYDENAGGPGEWTASAISGDWTFNDATQHYNGSVSISNLSEKLADTGATAQLAKGSDQDLTGYIAVTGWIRLTSIPSDSIIFGGYASGSLVGNTVDLRDYISVTELNVWQKFIITLLSLDLTERTIDAFRVTKSSRYTTFYIDYIRIQELGGSIMYSIKAPPRTWFHIHSVRWVFADVLAGTLADGTMPNLAYDQILGESKLASGIISQRVNDGVITETSILQQLLDFFVHENACIVDSGSDGTNTWIALETNKVEPVILKAENQDSYSYTITDDLSGLLEFSMTAFGKIEYRNK